MTRETRTAWAAAAGLPASAATASALWTATVPETYGLFRPAPTHLAAGTRAADLPCDEACPASAPPEPDAECEARGLHTGCQGQCSLGDDGAFWCLQRWYRTRDQAPAMGRACWGGQLQYVQLMKPCLVGDYRIGCAPCQGLNVSYRPRSLDGPGAQGGPRVGAGQDVGILKSLILVTRTKVLHTCT